MKTPSRSLCKSLVCMAPFLESIVSSNNILYFCSAASTQLESGTLVIKLNMFKSDEARKRALDQISVSPGRETKLDTSSCLRSLRSPCLTSAAFRKPPSARDSLMTQILLLKKPRSFHLVLPSSFWPVKLAIVLTFVPSSF